MGARRGPGSLQHIGILCEIEARYLHRVSHSGKEQEIHLGTANLCLEMFQQKLLTCPPVRGMTNLAFHRPFPEWKGKWRLPW